MDPGAREVYPTGVAELSAGGSHDPDDRGDEVRPRVSRLAAPLPWSLRCCSSSPAEPPDRRPSRLKTAATESRREPTDWRWRGWARELIAPMTLVSRVGGVAVDGVVFRVSDASFVASGLGPFLDSWLPLPLFASRLIRASRLFEADDGVRQWEGGAVWGTEPRHLLGLWPFPSFVVVPSRPAGATSRGGGVGCELVLRSPQDHDKGRPAGVPGGGEGYGALPPFRPLPNLCPQFGSVLWSHTSVAADVTFSKEDQDRTTHVRVSAFRRNWLHGQRDAKVVTGLGIRLVPPASSSAEDLGGTSYIIPYHSTSSQSQTDRVMTL
ncbi:hypothetical protein LXA43DRAFT_1084121 [Ganoderma leucocontextum]|nr:hypothetical protein LXA43DRAFT_1084121 [Ganoderma leucocontextum]